MDTRAIVKDRLRRQSALESARTPFEPLWRDAARRCLPVGADFSSQGSPAARADMSDNFDSTAMLALSKFAAALCSIATPPSAKWHTLVPADPDLADDTEVTRWCETARDRLFALRGHHLANFTASALEVYRQMGVFGHGAMFVHHDLGRAIRYMAVPVRELWFDTDAAGVLDTVHRRYKLTARQALDEFASDDLPPEIRNSADKPEAQDREFDFLHCVFPNPDHDPERADTAGKPWLSAHLCNDRLVRLSGFRAMPYLVPRYESIAGSAYGFGPALLALPDIRMLNEMGKTSVRAAHLSVEPPLLLKDDDLLSPFGLQPAYLNYGGIDDQGRPTVRALEMGQRLDIGLEFLQSRQGPVNDSFLVTLFQILVEQPQMTATEVLQRAQEKGILLAPVMARLQSELLGPLAARELDILFDIPGALPPAPPQLLETGGILRVEYASPLARTMQAGGEALGFQRLMEVALPLVQANPELMDLFNVEEGLRVLSQAVGAPASVLRSPQEVEALRARRAMESMLAQAAAGMAAGPGAGGLPEAAQAGLAPGAGGMPDAAALASLLQGAAGGTPGAGMESGLAALAALLPGLAGMPGAGGAAGAGPELAAMLPGAAGLEGVM